MKNIIKTLFVLITSVSLFGTAYAGELTVTGTAKATYNITSGYSNASKGLGVANEIDFGAKGELDNGWTWTYQIQLDPGNTSGVTDNSVQNDDTTLTLGTPYGTLGIFMTEGGLDLEDGASASVYGRPTDIGDPSATSDNADIDSYNNVQYHTPAGLLPFGLAFKYGKATGTDTTGNSANDAGVTNTAASGFVGDSVDAYQVKATPIDGLTVGASYVKFNNGNSNTVSADTQQQASYAAMATYATGAFKFGYSRAYFEPVIGTLDTTAAESYDQNNYSIAFNVNDSFSVSYEREASEKAFVASTTAKVEQVSSAIQAAYTMGGMTVAVSRGNYDNVGYAADKDATQTLIALTMAF
jgi:hypothetical protein